MDDDVPNVAKGFSLSLLVTGSVPKFQDGALLDAESANCSDDSGVAGAGAPKFNGKKLPGAGAKADRCKVFVAGCPKELTAELVLLGCPKTEVEPDCLEDKLLLDEVRVASVNWKGFVVLLELKEGAKGFSD